MRDATSNRETREEKRREEKRREEKREKRERVVVVVHNEAKKGEIEKITFHNFFCVFV
jgi:hypothetical protein